MVGIFNPGPKKLCEFPRKIINLNLRNVTKALIVAKRYI